MIPQRDVVGRLARREFEMIGQEMAYRFRDVYDQFARMADDAIVFQDRVTGVLEVNLATVSNRLNQVMKVLTVMSTIFLPLTVLTDVLELELVRQVEVDLDDLLQVGAPRGRRPVRAVEQPVEQETREVLEVGDDHRRTDCDHPPQAQGERATPATLHPSSRRCSMIAPPRLCVLW